MKAKLNKQINVEHEQNMAKNVHITAKNNCQKLLPLFLKYLNINPGTIAKNIFGRKHMIIETTFP